MSKLTVEEKQKEINRLAGLLRDQHLLFGNNILDGMIQAEAYTKAGYTSKTPCHGASNLLIKNTNLRKYIDLSREVAIEKAADDLKYGEEQWLRDILGAVDMSLGREGMVIQFLDEGEIREKKIKTVNLQSFARLSEQLGKKLALFTENRNLEGGLGLITKNIDKNMPAAEAAAIYQEMIGKK